MAIITIPKSLRDVLGDDATEAFIEVLNEQENQTKETVTETSADKFERRLTEEVSGLRVDLNEEVSELRVDLTGKIGNFRTDLSSQIEKSKADTIKWMFIFYIGQIGALLGILFAVFK